MTDPATSVRDTDGRTDSPAPDGAPNRKATLFCPDCGHEGTLDGGWEVQRAGDRRRVRCPECYHVVDDRRVGDPRPLRTDTPTVATPAPTPVRLCLGAWGRYWSTWRTFVAGRASSDY
jgi:DNA-directed RNA polymerase subunit RPC12/RpoP